jgi:hypothetical protein
VPSIAAMMIVVAGVFNARASRATLNRRLEHIFQELDAFFGCATSAFASPTNCSGLEYLYWSEKMRRRHEPALLPKSPLLITESADEFDALRDAFEREIKPRGVIEHMYVHDISSIVWEILRLRRCKAVIINAAFRNALQNLLAQLLREPGQFQHYVSEEAEALAQAWFKDKEAKKQVSEILGQFELDESAIEAEAIRRSSSDLELLDRMLTSLESRRDKALGCVAEYRASLAQQLRESADRILDGKVLRLEPEPNKRSTVA